MTRFAHISDVHLGGWKQPEMMDLNFQSFKMTVDTCIKNKLDFVLIAGDLFDSAYPPIEILKETFAQFKRLHDAKLPCFIIAGSHDYSVSGKTFLDVLEKAGFCKNVSQVETTGEPGTEEEKFILNPVLHEGVAIYGYPGKKSGLEIQDLRKLKINEAPGMYKIFMLHTSLDKALGGLPIDSISTEELPKADYYALGHLHIDFKHDNFVYPGPIFPNNFQELEDLKYGSFYLVDTEALTKSQKIELKIKDVLGLTIEVKDASAATQKIISEIEAHKLDDKIVLLRVIGELENGKPSDIKFQQIEELVKRKGAYFMLKNTHDLKAKQVDLDVELEDKPSEDIEEEAIKLYSEENPSDFNKMIPELMNTLSIDKQEGEKSEVFNTRLLESAKRLLKF
jgi:DNA repair protein SbcD/Mre11